jgi:dTMP kinase
VGLRRAGDAPDRIEGESLAFHRRVREGFLELAGQDPTRYLVVPADAPAEVVADTVRERLGAVLPASRVVRA